MKLHHDDPYPNARDTYECEKCGEKFRLKATLNQHICKEDLLL